MAKNNIEVPNGFKVLNPISNIDSFYGPYNSKQEALDETRGLRAEGRVVGIYNSEGLIEDFSFQKGIGDENLVLKSTKGNFEVSDSEITSQENVWIDSSDLHIDTTQSPAIASINLNINQIFDRLATIEYAFNKNMDSGDFSNKAGDDLANIQDIEPGAENDPTYNPDARPFGLLVDNEDGNPLDVEGIQPDLPDSDANLKHLRIKRGKWATFKPDSLQDGEFGYITDRNLLYIGNNGVAKLITGGTSGGGGEGPGGSSEYLELVVEGTDEKFRIRVNADGTLNVYNAEVETADDQQIITEGAEQLKGLYISMFYAGGESTVLSKDNPCSHNFIEIFNATSNDINLKGCSLQYGRVGTNWQVLPLKGIIPAQHAFLIRGARCAPDRLNTTKVNIDDFDIEWPTMRLNTTGTKIYLTIGTAVSTFSNPFNTQGANSTYANGYIDLVGIGGSIGGQNVDGYETASPNILTNTRVIYRRYFNDYNQRPANTRFGDTNNNKEDFQYVEWNVPLNVNNIVVYKPWTTKSGKKSLFFDKNTWDTGKPNMVTWAFGRDAHSTRTFNWVSVGWYDEYLQYRKVGDSDWITIESIDDINSPYNRVLVDGFDGIWFTVHKQIVRNLTAGDYEYRVGKENGWSDIYKFNVTPWTDTFGFVQVSDQQAWNWREYEPWRIAIEHIEDWENDKSTTYPATGTKKIDFYLNTGDMTENGIRPFEWMYYYNAGKNILPNYPQINVVGNNDLCPNPGELVGKVNPDSFEWFYTYEHNPNNLPLFEGKIMKSVYSFDYGNTHFVTLDANTGKHIEAQKQWFINDMEEVKARATKPRWIILLVHDAPFNIITDNQPKRDTLLNQIEDVDLNKRYSWSRLFEQYGVHLVLSGHKHTYSRSKPLLERLDNNGYVIPLTPIIQTLDSPTTGETQVSEITGIVYLMCQATGSKLDSNKDTPAQSIPFNAKYFPGGGNAQRYPTYIKLDVTPTKITHHSYQIKNIMPTTSYSYDPYSPITLPKERIEIDTSEIIKKQML